MARLESEAKGGYYPTPPEEMEHILKYLELSQLEENSEKEIAILDPCAGKGDALKQMSNYVGFYSNSKVITYGIELEKSRAEDAMLKLDHVLACGYEEARISHDAFSLMYLNPPFAEIQGERLEKVFLDELTRDYLGEGSLLILNIPQYVLKDVAKIIAHRFDNILVKRFSDENGNFDRFKQVIVFAVRRKRGILTTNERMYRDSIEQVLMNMSYWHKDQIEPLYEVNKQYTITPAVKRVQLFKSMKVDPNDIVQSNLVTNHYGRVKGMMSSLELTDSIRKITPALPLKVTHIAAAISAGALPESMGSHLLVGVTKTIQEELETYDPDTEKTKEITTFKPKSIVRVFSEKGIFNLK